jgi:hypothetical protein
MATKILSREEGLVLGQECLLSGLSFSDFARHQGLSKHVVVYWARKAKVQKESEASPAFVEVTAASPRSQRSFGRQDLQANYFIHHPSGLVIEVPGTRPLGDVLQALGAV